MSIVKPLNGSNLRLLPKKPFLFWIKSYLPAMLLSSLLGTYLDLYMVGRSLYHFTLRPFPAVFSINILFTLIFLPAVTIIFLTFMESWNSWKRRSSLILLLSLGMAVMEKAGEGLGLFIHSHHWNHLYTFIGYILFLLTIHSFHTWLNSFKM